ncbi:MAG: NUDIX hydrolase [Candidatus Shapirobacteria bacterium]|jgi:8-oxo-dGTP diphosphatase
MDTKLNAIGLPVGKISEQKVVVRAIIVNENSEVLLGKRARGMAEGKFAIIGGKPEKGENNTETVIREIREEIGVEFKGEYWYEEIDNKTDPKDPWKVVWFVGKITGGMVMDPNEVSDIIWASADRLDDLDLAFNHREVLEKFFREQNNLK